MFKRKDSLAAAGTPDEGSAVQAARTRARRRLIGAALLVGIGIVGFPLLFETQPRPIAVDIPIEIPSREDAAALKLPASKPSAPALAVPAEPTAASAAPAPMGVASAAAAAQATAAPLSASAADSSRAVSHAERDAVPAVPPTPPRAAAEPQRGAIDAQRDAQRAQALLDGKPLAAALPPASAAAGKSARFVVQAGAYTDRRTRVRVGPFDSRDDAEKAAARIKSAGLAASILSL